MSFGDFTAPIWFVLLAVVAALIVGYGWSQRRRRQHTLRFANLAMLERVAPRRPGWPRHIPAALLLVALIMFTVALAGPTAEAKVPRNRATVMLIIDVSLSMQASDVTPSRLTAAQRAASTFADDLTPGVNLGLVSFAGSPTVLVSPTTERAPVKGAIANLTLAEATATGEAVYAGLQAIDTFGQVMGDTQGPPPARVVLLTDGKQTIPPDQNDERGAFTAARAAAEAKVPISTISFGTEYGSVDIQGERIPVKVDDESMREIARLSGGEFYNAATAGELDDVYSTLSEQIGYEIKRKDASKPWYALGTVTVMAAVGVALGFGQRLP